MSVLCAAAAGGADRYRDSQKKGIIIMTRDQTEVFGGVDTHTDTHVVAAVDADGPMLGAESFPADAAGYTRLLAWLKTHGPLAWVGVEGAGSDGAGLARRLAAAGVAVLEVNRPNRQTRRRRGKTDTVDAEAAARAALCGEATAKPKAGDGPVEAIRMLRVARRSAVKARTQASNQISGLVVTAGEHLKDRLRGLRTSSIVKVCAGLRPDTSSDEVEAPSKRALRSLARRHQALSAEIAELDAALLSLCQRANPALLAACGVGADTTAALLVAAGDNPTRMRHEASFAALCGASPVEASSGHTIRHCLNRGGNRQANNAGWRIAMTRLRVDERTIAYAQRRRSQPKTRRQILRCLKRYITRQIYQLLTNPPPIPHRADLRRQRTRHRLTLDAIAQALHTHTTRVSELQRGLHHNRDRAERYQQHLTQITT